MLLHVIVSLRFSSFPSSFTTLRFDVPCVGAGEGGGGRCGGGRAEGKAAREG